MKQETLIFVIDRAQSRVLLAMKKVRFGAGKFNGMGGGMQEGETPRACVVRELFEESGVTVQEEDVKPMGAITFSFEHKPEWTRIVYLFAAEQWSGEPVESEEMAPRWFSLDAIPYDKMWIDDKYWLPQFLAGEPIDAEFHFNNDGSAILSQRVNHGKN